MKKEIKILKKISNYVKKLQNDKEIERLEEKERVLNLLNMSWTEAQIKNYNDRLLINSDFWVGGDYTEKDIKGSVLKRNSYLFTNEEFADLYYKIYPKEKTK